ncbi:hypothetical protein CFC21_045757 [Triticum aestivum]|uniref:F-box domain-containing protein n=2 Tax=Triticum aestivum TaxID=4565 RepID=A0A9R1FUN5_WHEAT|nr:hypothetical protein CFC21_045757 [Triticum aestivum]
MTRRRSPRLHPQIPANEQPAGMAVRRSPRLLSQNHTTEDGSSIALRRSPRLNPQIPVSGKGAGATRRRSSRLNPQIRVGEEGSGVTHRRSPRLNPQLHASDEGAGRRTTRLHHSSEEGSGVTRRRRRRGTSAAAPAALPDDDDMLREILLRLPPQPSSLPRASAVCKRWQRVATDPRFLSSFSAHHRKPPLLGFFEPDFYDIVFTSILDPPDRVPPERFDARRQIRSFRKAEVLGCRHGLVLLLESDGFIVWDPITSEHRRIDVPEAFEMSWYFYGAVLCAAADQGHMHGSCHSRPFNLVLMAPCQGSQSDGPPIACVYSSETGLWGDLISTTDRCEFVHCNRGILVGNVLYWSSKSVSAESNYLDLDELADDIIEFDLDSQSLALIKGPRGLNYSTTHQIIQLEDGDLGLAILSHGRFEMWQRKVSCQGGATWFLQKTLDIDSILGLPSQVEESSMRKVEILGYDEDNGVMFLFLDTNVYMLQVMSMQSRKLHQSRYANNCHPFTSFYGPGS